MEFSFYCVVLIHPSGACCASPSICLRSGTATRMTESNSRLRGRQSAHSEKRSLTATMSSLGLLCDAVASAGGRVLRTAAQQPVEAGEQLARHGDPGHRLASAFHQSPVRSFHFRVITNRDRGRLHQRPAQERAALFADVAEALPFTAGVLGRDQARAPPPCPARRSPGPTVRAG